jgi:chemotaxis protein methyltransferase CheR
MIYFDRPTQERILRRFAPLMRSNGLLFAGHSESLFQVSDAFRLLGKTVYTPAQGVRAGAAAPVRKTAA